MPQLRTYKVFISHAWEYSDDYWAVVAFLQRGSQLPLAESQRGFTRSRAF